jgi:hypothetical protein
MLATDSVSSAVIAGVVALLVAGCAAMVNVATTRSTLRHEREKLEAEMRTQFMAEAAIRELLLQEGWEQRSFTVIQNKVGGFEDDELRQLLVRSGAVRFFGKDPQQTEYWGLRERNAAE